MPDDLSAGGRIARWRMYWRVSKVGSIARRYFVMNAFDGALTMLGVVIGAHISGKFNPGIVLLAGLSGAIAMAISGFSGAYMTESAERSRKLKKLERAMLTNMGDTLQEEASRFATTVTALIDAISPLVASLLVISPFMLAEMGLLPLEMAFYSSLLITLIIMLVLGIYLARISDGDLLRYGVRMLVVGAVTALLCIVVAVLLGASVV